MKPGQVIFKNLHTKHISRSRDHTGQTSMVSSNFSSIIFIKKCEDNLKTRMTNSISIDIRRLINNNDR